MAIVTISRASYSGGEHIGQRVAKKLGYECVDREIILEASEEFKIPETKLVRAIHNAPSSLEGFGGGKQKYIAYIQCKLMQRVRKDNVVYHGLAGHFFLPSIAHVIKVRIITDLGYRIRVVMDRDNVSRDEALRILTKDDEERNKWSRKLYGIEQSDASLYDLVLNIDKISVDKTIDIICQVASLEGFRTTPESQKEMEDFALACYVKTHLLGLKPDIEVQADDGNVTVLTVTYPSQEDALTREISGLVSGMPGVKDVHVVTISAPHITG